MTLNIADLWQSIRARWGVVGIVAGTVFALAVILAFVQSRQYLATSSLLVDLTQVDQSDNTIPQSASIIDSIVGTQVSVLKSDLVLDEVTRKSGIVENPSDPVDISKAQRRIAKNLQVETDRASNVISVSYIDPDPETAARIANLFADTLLAKQVELRVNPARVNAKWYNARTAEVRQRFEQAQRKLTDFQRANGMIGVDRMDLEGEKLKSLSMQLAEAQGVRAEARAKVGSAAMPEVSSALSVQGIEQQMASKAANVAELSKSLGPNHPDMRAAQAELAALRTQLNQARGVQASSLTAASGAATRREADLRQQMAEQQARMLQLSGTQDQMMILQRDVDAARQTYDQMRQRFNDQAIKSEVSQANTTILDRASAPRLPFKPNVSLWLIGGLLFGLIAGTGVALLLEILSPRVRSAGGLAQATDVEVLADFSAARPAPNFA